MMTNTHKLVAFIVVLSAIKFCVAHAEESEFDAVWMYKYTFATEIPGKRVFYRTGTTMTNKEGVRPYKNDEGKWRILARKPNANCERGTRTVSAMPKYTFFLGNSALIQFTRKDKTYHAYAKIVKIEQGVAKCELSSGEVVVANKLFKTQCQNFYKREPSTMKKGDDCRIEHNGEWKWVTFEERNDKEYKFTLKRSWFLWNKTITISNEKVNTQTVRFPKQCESKGFIAHGEHNPKGSNTIFHNHKTEKLWCQECFIGNFGRRMNQPQKTQEDGRKSATKFAQSGEDTEPTSEKKNEYQDRKTVCTKIMKEFVARLLQARDENHTEDVFQKAVDKLLKGMKRHQKHRMNNPTSTQRMKPSFKREQSRKAKTGRRAWRNIKQEALGEFEPSSESTEYTVSDASSQTQASSDSSSRKTVESTEYTI